MNENTVKSEVADFKNNQPNFIVGVQFMPSGKIYSFATSDESLCRFDMVMVESDDGPAIATVVMPPRSNDDVKPKKNMKSVLRKATESEIDEMNIRRERALEHMEICKEQAKEYGLNMKFVDAKISGNGKKITFYFCAEHRVDFRKLVKDIAGKLKMRIEMRQIGARDEAKFIGSLGTCGHVTCCTNHLRSFESISISMAKQQGLSPNPSKLTGICGKLKCCIAYEHDVYKELKRGLPKMGASVESPSGTGKIVDMNILKRECGVALFAGSMARCSCDDCRVLSKSEREDAIKEARHASEEIEAMHERRRKKVQRKKETRHGKKKR